ncbi:MAG: hypothetical protein K0V04_26360 [Deltaproteobacteria bacterium]|nr:hypothetical protein [Deltaproteobacteria bacterium]
MMTANRPIFAVLIGATMLTNCIAITEDGDEPQRIQADQADDAELADALVVIDAPERDAGRSYYTVRVDPEDERSLWLQGYDDHDREVSRLSARQHVDPDGNPWFQIALDDEDVSFEGHVRMVTGKDGQAWVELDAELDGRVVAIRTTPSDPTNVQVLGFPGAPADEFVAVGTMEGPHPMLDRLVQSLGRYGEIAPALDEALTTVDGLRFRTRSCLSCYLSHLGALSVSVACISLSVVAAGVCLGSVGTACGQAVAAAAGGCGMAQNLLASFVDTTMADCQDACSYYDEEPVVDPCAGGCSCPGGPA